jgi:hypothetical protein
MARAAALFSGSVLLYLSYARAGATCVFVAFLPPILTAR